jgi:ATP-dependent Clp protease ATP-binding subunit ClpB
MTSNVGSQFILESFDKTDWALVESQVINELRRVFRPEFLNRVDDVIVFRPLREEQIEQIAELQLGRLRRLLGDRKMTLEVTPAAKRILATEGYDPAFGARPLKRTIQRMIQDPLALQVLEGRFVEGDHIVVDAGPDGQLRFERADAREAAAARA